MNDSKPCIALVCPNLINASPINALTAIANHLSRFFTIKIFVYGERNNSDALILKRLASNGVEVSYFGSSKVTKVVRVKYWLENQILKNNVCLAISFLFKADLALSLVSNKIIKVCSLRDMLHESLLISHGKLVAELANHLQKLALRRFDKLITMSDEMTDYYALRHEIEVTKLVCIPNFLDESRLKAANKHVSDIYFNNNDPVLISISSLIKRKRIDKLMDFVERLNSESFPVNLLIIGDGPLAEELKLRSRDNICLSHRVRFVGQLRNPYDALKEADIFVSASESEGLSRSILESLYFNVPCLVSGIPSNVSLSLYTKGLYLFQEYEDFKKNIIEIISNKVRSKLPIQHTEAVGLNSYTNLIQMLISSPIQ